jgi:hypothetical protein
MTVALRTSITVAILMGCRGDKPPAPVASGTESEPTPAPAKVAVRERPTLPDPTPPAAPTLPRHDGIKSSAETVFAKETRDEDWAPGAEKELVKRFAKVRGAKLEDTECRHSQCRMVMAGNQAEVSRAISDLEGSRGLHGYAKNIVLTAPEKKSDGTLVLRAFAVFDR